MDSCPDELLLAIFTAVPAPRDRLALLRVSRRCRRVMRDVALWTAPRVVSLPEALIFASGITPAEGADVGPPRGLRMKISITGEDVPFFTAMRPHVAAWLGAVRHHVGEVSWKQGIQEEDILAATGLVDVFYALRGSVSLTTVDVSLWPTKATPEPESSETHYVDNLMWITSMMLDLMQEPHAPALTSLTLGGLFKERATTSLSAVSPKLSVLQLTNHKKPFTGFVRDPTSTFVSPAIAGMLLLRTLRVHGKFELSEPLGHCPLLETLSAPDIYEDKLFATEAPRPPLLRELEALPPRRGLSLPYPRVETLSMGTHAMPWLATHFPALRRLRSVAWVMKFADAFALCPLLESVTCDVPGAAGHNLLLHAPLTERVPTPTAETSYRAVFRQNGDVWTVHFGPLRQDGFACATITRPSESDVVLAARQAEARGQQAGEGVILVEAIANCPR